MTLDGIGSSFSLHKWNNSLLAVNDDAGPLSIFFLQTDGKTWKEKAAISADWVPFDLDPSQNRFAAAKGSRFGELLTVNFYTGMMNPNGDLVVEANYTWKTDRRAFFGLTREGVYFDSWTNNGPVTDLYLGGIFSASEIYFPYSIDGETIKDGALIAAEGPFNNGVFFSLDSGKTWQREGIDSTSSAGAKVSKTDEFYYFTAGRKYTHELWFSRKAADGGTWSTPAVITDQYAAWGLAFAEGTTVHACWLDRRNEKKRLNAFNPLRKNYEVGYSHRKDSEPAWSEDIILSKGLLYAYEPVIAVDGLKLVVAWSGVQHDKDGHARTSPNDVFYVTSKDGGDTWAEPMKVTDGFKEGITSGKVQVAVLNGVIHLFYAQGKMSFKQASAGLALVNQPPWPIYYTQRPFPE